jgi:hypothetical protein
MKFGSWRDFFRPEDASWPESPFPIHRPAALEYLQDAQATADTGAQRAQLKWLYKKLAGDKLISCVLPVNGRYLDHRQPLSLRLRECLTPASAFLLEYSISPEFYSQAARDTLHPDRTVLWVQSKPWQGALELWAIWFYEKPATEYLFDPADKAGIHRGPTRTAVQMGAMAPIGLALGYDGPLQVQPDGTTSIMQWRPVRMANDRARTEDELQKLVGNYMQEVMVLVQFLTVGKTPNIRLRRVAAPHGAPGKYYVCHREGPSDLPWLRTSGLCTP